MLTALASGLLLGLSAGLAPGPLLALVLAQTLRHGPREGCKVALSPLVTDVPIIVVAFALASKLAQLRWLLGLASVAGSAFVLYLAWETLNPGPLVPGAGERSPGSWMKGFWTNLLNPHPWLFWLTVGAATLAEAYRHSWQAMLAFLLGFYLLLVGSKIVVALLAARSRRLLTGRGYLWTLRGLAVLLAVFAFMLLVQGIRDLAGPPGANGGARGHRNWSNQAFTAVNAGRVQSPWPAPG